MSIQVECSGFAGKHANINGKQTIEVNTRKLLLSALTCGYDGFFRSFGGKTGFRRIAHILGAVVPFIQRNQRYGFTLAPYYYDIDRSEGTHGIYYIGQGLTKVFAQQILDAPIVLHASRCEWTNRLGTDEFTPKAAIVDTSRKEADLMAFERSGSCHVLEAKGRSIKLGDAVLSKSILNSARRDALSQVSNVFKVNGQEPKTRTACVWSLGTTNIRGDAFDPEGKGFETEISNQDIVSSNYAAFIETQNASYRSDVVDGFDCVQISKGLFLGVKSEIRRALLEGVTDLDFYCSAGIPDPKRVLDDGNRAFLLDGTVIFFESDEETAYNAVLTQRQ